MAKRPADLLLVLAFAALLCLPGAAMLLRNENPLAKTAAPADFAFIEEVQDLPKRFEAAFGLRRSLIRANNLLRLALFQESPVNAVVLGKSPWLFYAGEWTMEDFENRLPYSQADLEHIRRNLEARRDWLAARGARYLVVIAPNKHSIYGDSLPGRFAKARPDSRLDQVAAYFAAHSDLEFLDLRPALFEARARERVYDHTDTHWNDPGGFAGANAILERLGAMFEGVRPLSREEYELVKEDGPGGDLAGLLSLRDVFREERLNLVKKTPALARPGTRDYADPATIAERAMVVRETGNKKAPRALIFRDSYAWRLIPFLSEGLQSAVYVWDQRFFPDIVERERPDVVIRECVERYLNALTRETPGIYPPGQ